MPRKVKKARDIKKQKVKNVKNKLKRGGAITYQPSGYPPGSTSGDFDSLVDDIAGIFVGTYNTVANAIQTVEYIIELPSDIGKAYDTPAGQSLGGVPIK